MLNWLIKTIYLLVNHTLFSLFSKRIFWNSKYIPAFYDLSPIRPESNKIGLDYPNTIDIFIPYDVNRCPEVGDVLKLAKMEFCVLEKMVHDNWLVDNLRIKLICGLYTESETTPKPEEVKSQEFSLKEEFPSLINPYIPKVPEAKLFVCPNINWSEISINFPPEIKLDYNLPSLTIDSTTMTIPDKIEFKPLMNNYHSYTASMPTTSSSTIPSYILLNTVI